MWLKLHLLKTFKVLEQTRHSTLQKQLPLSHVHVTNYYLEEPFSAQIPP